MSGRLTETRRKATEIQQTAGQPGESFWVSANAGTGKTHVLTNRIVRLLMSGVTPHSILCLTYTKAAATEMANRLGALLGKWAVLPDDELLESYRDQTGVPLDPDDLPRVRRLFAEVADTTDGPNIRTIHSFCESLLGRFPLEAGVAPHFAVMDERTAAELRSEARDRVLASAAVDPNTPAARAMDKLAGLVAEDAFDGLMAELDFARGRLAGLLNRHGGPAGLAAATRRQLGLPADADRRSVILDAPPADEPALRRAVEALSGGKKTDKDRAERMAPWLAGDADNKVNLFDEYALAYLTKTHTPQARLITKGVEDAHPGTLAALEAEQARVLAIDEQLRALTIADNTAALMDLADQLAAEYAGLKETRALMDYDDLILKTRELLAPDSPQRQGAVAWVHYKLDGGIAHILVDEAQDTAPAQWDILKALADEFFAGAGAWDTDDKGARTVFAVGDEKQSIYSFQGAEPARFEQTREHFARRATDADMNHRLDRSLEMAVSFRSTTPVLDTVDRTFETDDLRASVTSANIIRHLIDRDGDAGRVELWPTVTHEEEDEPDAWDAPVDKPGPRAPVVQVAETIAQTVRDWLDRGEVLESLGRPVSEGDILILVRKRGRFMEEMVRQLKLRGIKVAGADRMILTEQMAVMDLIALGRFVLLPEDDLTLATVLKGPLFNFGDDDDLTPLCHPRKGTLWSELRARADETSKWQAAADRLSELLAAADQAPPFEFYADLLGPGGGRRAFHRHLGQDALDPIEEFLALALQFEREHPPSLEGFLHWIGGSETVVKRDLEQASGHVRVMTVHGAKGLEAPIVFLPDTCQASARGKPVGLLWDDQAVYWPGSKAEDCDLTADLRAGVAAAREDEERRLLYVAMTRARDRLYVTGWEGKRGRTEGCWYDLIQAGLTRAGAKAQDHPQGGEVLLLDWPQTAPVTPRPSGDRAADLPSPGWLAAPPPDEHDPPRPLAPSRPEEAPPAASPLGEDDGARFKRGLIVHRLLESLPDIAPEDRERAAKRYLSRPAHELTETEQAEILAETLVVLNDAALGGLFGPGSRAEVPLVAMTQGRVVSARIDRLLVTDSEVLIADFKTNRPPPDRIEDVAPAYISQMAGYRAALRDIYPDRPVRCALIWTLGARLMPLPDAILDAAAR